MEHMPRAWREFLGRRNALPGGAGLLPLVPLTGYEPPLPPAGDRIANYAELAASLIADRSIDKVVIACREALLAPAHPNTYLGLEVARAANRWTVERWLAQNDDRVYGLVVVPNHLPEQAAEEIRLVGLQKQIVGVALCANGIGKPFGHPLYQPIFRAAADMDLPVVIFAEGDGTPDTLTQPAAGGLPATYAEYHMLALHPVMTHIVSLISQGIFQKFPSLRVIAAGTGILGLPSVMWRFDNNYRALRREVPWLRHFPREYFQRHVSMLTYPMDTGSSVESMQRALEAIEGLENQVCFASGRPAWDSSSHASVTSRLPSSWIANASYSNALNTYRFPERGVPSGGSRFPDTPARV
jgi:predicted TIM-barrel fold metal-dependent hydrolase